MCVDSRSKEKVRQGGKICSVRRLERIKSDANGSAVKNMSLCVHNCTYSHALGVFNATTALVTANTATTATTTVQTSQYCSYVSIYSPPKHVMSLVSTLVQRCADTLLHADICFVFCFDLQCLAHIACCCPARCVAV